MPRLAGLVAALHGLTSLVIALWITMYYPNDLSFLQATIVILWLICGIVLSHRYLELERAAEHRGFQWMKDRLLDASGDETGHVVADEAPW